MSAGGRYYESDIYNDELNRETVSAFDREFRLRMRMII